VSKLAAFRRRWVTCSQDFRGVGSSPCQHIDTTRKAVECATTLPLTVFGRPFVKRFALCYRTVVLSCAVCPVCGVRALWPNGWTDQDETWHAGRPLPWPHCVRWGPSSPSPKEEEPPNFRPISVAAKIKMSLGMEVGLGPGYFVLDRDPTPPSPKGGAEPPNFRSMFIAAKRLDG